MTSPSAGIGARPIGENRVQERLLDPLRLNNPETQDAKAETKADDGRQQDIDSFSDYLNSASVGLVEKKERSTEFDPAEAIADASVYGQPVGKTIV